MRRFFLILIACSAFYALVVAAFLAFTDVQRVKTEYPVVHYDRASKKASIGFSKQKPATWVSLGQVSDIATVTILLSEDSAFYQHNGFDWNQIEYAFRKNWEKKKFVRGGSTISQQVVKNVFLSSHKSIGRKLQEAVLTVRLEREVRKRRILEVYLNIAEFGEGLFGIEPAARFYFRKSASELTAKEGAFLAMLLPSPKKYSSSFRKKELSRYASSVIHDLFMKLVVTYRLTQTEADRQLGIPLSFERSAEPSIPPITPELNEEDSEEEESDSWGAIPNHPESV